MQHYAAQLTRFLRARLSPQGYLGLHLTIGAALMIGAAWLFGDIAEDVVHAEAITLLDTQVLQWLQAHASPLVTRCLLLVTHLHGTVGVLALSMLLALYLKTRRERDWLLTLVLAVPGGMLLNVILKQVFQRARPILHAPYLHLESYSFPSGHTMGATLLYGLLAAFLFWRLQSWGARIAACLAAALMIAAVGLSRMYLGVHYLSDVLAAIAAGAAWLALCITAVSTLRRRRLHDKNSTNQTA